MVADEAYLRESILNPTAKMVTGFQPVMPTFQGQLSEEQILQLIQYIKSLKARRGPASPGHRGAPRRHRREHMDASAPGTELLSTPTTAYGRGC